jgi:hypothetical protein
MEVNIMIKQKLVILLIMLVLLGALFVPNFAQEKSTNQKGELTVPWDEFKKLVDVDKNEIVISLESFQKLLAQTGTKTKPPHTVKEGNVVLKRAEFKKLINAMKPVPGQDEKPPFDYLITKAFYQGKMQNNNTEFTGTFTIHVLKENAYLKVPLVAQSIALADIRINGEQALVVSQNGYFNVVLFEAGEYEVTVSFSLKSSLDKGPHKIDLTIQQTPITMLRLEMPLKDIDVEVPQAQHIKTSLRGNSTIVSAVITQGRAISVRWKKKVAVTEKIPPKVYCEVNHLISIEDDALKINSDINYNILHSEVDAVRLSIQENMNVLTVSGEGVGEWQESAQGDLRLILIPFTYGKKGAVTVRVTAETSLSETGLANVFSGFQALETVRETGFIGVELNTSAEVVVPESDGLEKVAIQKLPQRLINKSVKPLILGFKYLKHPFNLVLDIKKHEKIGVPVATINSVSVVTLFTEDGKVVHRLVYQIRNSAKQFLEIQLPENADVWSVFVDNQPVESSINGLGKLLVPLIRSHFVNNRLDTFPVEIIYCMVEDRFSVFGWQQSNLPAVDLLISQLIWSVYLPNDYSYHYFTSTLEKEDIIRGLNIFAGNQRQYDDSAMREVTEAGDYEDRDKMKRAYKGKDYKSQFKNVPMKEEQMANQMVSELEFSGRLDGLATQQKPRAAITSRPGATGILPIQIEVPTGGQVYRFARTIIKTEDPLSFSVFYSRLWIKSLIKWFILILVVLIILLTRKRLVKPLLWCKEKILILFNFWKKHQAMIKKYALSPMTPFVLIGLVFVCYTFSWLLTVLFLFQFWVSLVYQILNYRKAKEQIKTKLNK